MTGFRIPAEMVFTREFFEIIEMNSDYIPLFMMKVFGILIMEAIGKEQFRFCNIKIIGKGELCCITYFTKGYSTDQEYIKIDDILKSFEGKMIDVSTSAVDRDHD